MECSADRIAWRLKANTGVSATLKPESHGTLVSHKTFTRTADQLLRL